MAWFQVSYIHGVQTNALRREHVEIVESESLETALRDKSEWPLEIRFNCTSAWAKNPGTSIYYIEAWEAECIDPPQTGQ